MFFYIGGILAGFAIGYIVAIAQNRKGGYRKGINDCRNCKNMVWIDGKGTVQCKRAEKKFVSHIPKACGLYEQIGESENEN